MKRKQIIENTLLVVFFIAAIGSFLKLPYFGLLLVIGGFLLGILYFNLGFWLFAETGISTINKIIIGLIFGVNIVSIIFCLQHFPNWRLFGIINFVGLATALIICALNLKNVAYKKFLYRCVFFIFTFSAIYIYRCSMI